MKATSSPLSSLSSSTLSDDSSTEETSETAKEAKALTKFDQLSVTVVLTVSESPRTDENFQF